MGLFNSAQFDPSSYQDDGGLIARLLAQLGTQGQYQPGAGMPPSPMDANAQQQNAPIAVGNYQMPRIGGGFQDDQQQQQQPTAPAQPGESVLPRQTSAEQDAGLLPAQFRNGQQSPIQQPAQAPGLPQPYHSPGGFGGAMRGAVANLSGGPLGMIAGAIGGGMGMGRGTAQDQQQNALMQQYQALVPILGPEKAKLAVINPEAGKILISEAISNHQKFTKTGQDGLGREQYGFVDETNQTVNGKPLSAQPAQDAGGGLGNMNLTGKDYLASLAPKDAKTVQGMVDGTLPVPSSFAMGKPYWQNMIAAAKNYDPTFDGTQWSGRIAGVRDFAAGKSSEMVRSANQTIGHVGDLITKMDALNNGSYPLLNKAENFYNTSTGGAATTGFGQTAHAVADELSKVFKGAGISILKSANGKRT